MKNCYIALLILCLHYESNAQYQGNVWCFGDSLIMKFDQLGNFSFDSCYAYNHESTASIADSSGNLIMYLVESGNNIPHGAFVYNHQNLKISGGDSLYANPSAAGGLLILPIPDSSYKYCILHTSYDVDTMYAFFASYVDMSLNGGLGAVTSKNISLTIPNDSICDALAAVKHANGRDWWIATHSLKDSSFYFFLLTPNGISLHHSQAIGSLHWNTTIAGTFGGSGAMRFSQQGDKLLAVDNSGIIDVFDFDRCTGSLSSWISLDSVYSGFNEIYLGCSFSPNENVVYVSSELALYQYNLLSPTPQNGITIYNNSNPNMSLGHHLLGPDNKIYISNWSGAVNSYDTINKHLDVINLPDSVGFNCFFQPTASFLYVGEKGKTKGSLPNMPNFNLGPVAGSICDSLFVGINILYNEDPVKVYPNPSKGLFTFSLKTKIEHLLSINFYNIDGQHIFSQLEEFTGDEFTVDLRGQDPGIYIAKLSYGGKSIYKKLVVEP